jgi:hypothetical protein
VIGRALCLEWNNLEVSDAEGKNIPKDEVRKALTQGEVILE